jgi:hypothetical protein
MNIRIPIALILIAIVVLVFVRWEFRSPSPVAAGQSRGAGEADSNQNVSSSADANRKEISAHLPPTGSKKDREQWSRELIEEIRLGLNSTNETVVEETLTTLFPALLSGNVEAAAELARGTEVGPLRDNLMRLVAQYWSRSDPKRALEWASRFPEGAERDSILTMVCGGIAESDPPAGIAAAEANGLGNANGTLENLAQLWGSKDLSAALDWATQRPNGEQRDHILARLAYLQAETDPATAADLIARQINPGPIQMEAAISVLHQWALQDSAAASEWLRQFPEGPLRQRGEGELAGIANYQKSAASAP